MRVLTVSFIVVSIITSAVHATSLIPKADLSAIDPEAARLVQQLESAFIAIRTSKEPVNTESLPAEAQTLACELLSHENAAIPRAALEVLQQYEQTVDLSGVARCFDRLPLEQILGLVLDQSRLFFLDEAEKHEILRQCLRKGSYELWHGRKITANYCIGTAAWDGVEGLRADI